MEQRATTAAATLIKGDDSSKARRSFGDEDGGEG